MLLFLVAGPSTFNPDCLGLPYYFSESAVNPKKTPYPYYGWFRLFEDRCRNCVGLGTDYYLFLQSNHRVPKDPRNYFTGSHRVTLDNGILLPFSHCSRLKLERGTRQLVYHYPLYPYIWLLVLVSKMPQYNLIKAAFDSVRNDPTLGPPKTKGRWLTDELLCSLVKKKLIHSPLKGLTMRQFNRGLIAHPEFKDQIDRQQNSNGLYRIEFSNMFFFWIGDKPKFPRPPRWIGKTA
jgi:hypothetical protein